VFGFGSGFWKGAASRAGVGFALAVVLGMPSPPGWGRSDVQTATERTVALDELPVEARLTRQLIGKGGPFPYRKDGTTFFNRERLLPAKPRGYYREYTVRTPGASNRGARRIVCGGQEPTRPSNCYYTADHYASFRLIIE
jgi:ribonuclease T1